MTDNTTPSHETRFPDEIFPLLSEEHRRDVVARALQHREDCATEGVRKRLNASLRRLTSTDSETPAGRHIKGCYVQFSTP